MSRLQPQPCCKQEATKFRALRCASREGLLAYQIIECAPHLTHTAGCCSVGALLSGSKRPCEPAVLGNVATALLGMQSVAVRRVQEKPTKAAHGAARRLRPAQDLPQAVLLHQRGDPLQGRARAQPRGAQEPRAAQALPPGAVWPRRRPRPEQAQACGPGLARPLVLRLGLCKPAGTARVRAQRLRARRSVCAGLEECVRSVRARCAQAA